MAVITFIICTHTESRLIRAYFYLHLFQKMSWNPLLTLGNPLRIHCKILEYAVLDRTGYHAASVLLLMVFELYNLRVHFLILSAACSAETKHFCTLDGLYFVFLF